MSGDSVSGGSLRPASLVELDDVTVTYRQRPTPALVGASLSIAAGELLLVAGASGSGKSTLLRVINGLVPRSYRATVTGRVLVAGRPAATASLRTISETVGTLLQDPRRQVVGTTVLAELAFGLENRGVDPTAIRARVEAVAARLDLTALLDVPTSELSGGQLQLVAFAAILALEPAVIIVDEPLANLDPNAAHRLLTAVRAYVDAGGAAIVVEHRVSELLSVRPDQVVYLEAGRVTYTGGLDAFLAAADPEEIKVPFSVLVEREAQRLDAEAIDAPDEDDSTARLRDSGEHPRAPRDPAPRDPAAHLAYRGAALGYRGRVVISVPDTAFGAREHVAVLGPNGAGKSTLLRAAVRLIDPVAGAVLIDGRPVSALGVRELVSTFGYLFQNPAQSLFSSTVREELAFGPRNLGVGETEITERTTAALAAVLLDTEPGILDRPPHTLSFGQQRRLAIAIAIALQPRTLILDEPTAGQDERSTAHFLSQVLAIDTIESVYLITHDVDLALTRADRVVVVDRGGILADATPAELVADASLWVPAAEPAPAVGMGAPLRETGLVRAARELCPKPGRLPSARELARRAARRTATPSNHRHPPPEENHDHDRHLCL